MFQFNLLVFREVRLKAVKNAVMKPEGITTQLLSKAMIKTKNSSAFSLIG